MKQRDVFKTKSGALLHQFTAHMTPGRRTEADGASTTRSYALRQAKYAYFFVVLNYSP